MQYYLLCSLINCRLIVLVTFRKRKPCSSQENRKHQEKKKFVLYALYGWGCPLILNIVCAMIEFVLTVPENIVRPQFCVGNRNWFNGKYGNVNIIMYIYISQIINIYICVSL